MIPKVRTSFSKYKQPGVAVDVILFRLTNDDLEVGLFKRKTAPYKGTYTLEGRFVRYDEKIEDTAKIALQEKVGVNPNEVKLEQLYTFGQTMTRDTRIRTITIVYTGLIKYIVSRERTQHDIEWFSAYDLPKMGFDHKEIIEYAVDRLRSKVIWDLFIFDLMPAEFTLAELQKGFEIILGEKLDKRNFRKKIAEQDVLVETGRKKREGVHRPAMLYTFDTKAKTFHFRA